MRNNFAIETPTIWSSSTTISPQVGVPVLFPVAVYNSLWLTANLSLSIMKCHFITKSVIQNNHPEQAVYVLNYNSIHCNQSVYHELDPALSGYRRTTFSASALIVDASSAYWRALRRWKEKVALFLNRVFNYLLVGCDEVDIWKGGDFVFEFCA
jgi:hypothetical protein